MCCIFLTPFTKIFTKYFTKYCTVSYTVFTRLLSIEACVPILHVNLWLLDLLITCASPTRRRRLSAFTTRTTGVDTGVGGRNGYGSGHRRFQTEGTARSLVKYSTFVSKVQYVH